MELWTFNAPCATCEYDKRHVRRGFFTQINLPPTYSGLKLDRPLLDLAVVTADDVQTRCHGDGVLLKTFIKT